MLDKIEIIKCIHSKDYKVRGYSGGFLVLKRQGFKFPGDALNWVIGKSIKYTESKMEK